MLAASATLIGTVALVSVSSAEPAAKPVISGDPIVGHVLTSSSAGDTALYRWQSCDPAVANCTEAPFPDANWTDLTEASADNQEYAVQGSDLGHYIRVLAKGTSLGEQFTPSAPVGPVTEDGTPVPVATPSPVHGVQVLGEPVEGTPKIKLPGQKGFSPLNGLSTIPVNTVIDTRGSRIRLIAATGDYGDETPDESVDFFGGLFRLTQDGSKNAVATAKLIEKLRCPKGNGTEAKAGKSSGPIAATAGKRRRRVWGSGHGSYGTAGSGGTGSVRGTTWLTQDTCKGTLFKVTEGLGITVFDFDLGTSVDLGPGQSYFAKKR